MDDFATLDATDRRLINALQLDGRESATRLADALGLAERTVTRRLNRMLESGIVRIVLSRAAAPESASVTVILRVRVFKGKVHEIASALARRSDIQFVDIMENGQEIVASSTTPSPSRARNIVAGIASSSDVVEVTSHTGLHLYADPASWNLGVLSAEEVEAITPKIDSERPDWTADDPAIREVLASNARMPLAELARRTTLSLSTVRRRVEHLTTNGLLRTVALVDREALGLSVDANINLTVPPASIDEVGRRLAQTPGVHGAAATTGVPNMFAAVYCTNLPALHEFVVGTLGSLDVTAAEVSLVGTSVKRAGVLLPSLSIG